METYMFVIALENPLPDPSVGEETKEWEGDENHRVGEQRGPDVAGPASHGLPMRNYIIRSEKKASIAEGGAGD